MGVKLSICINVEVEKGFIYILRTLERKRQYIERRATRWTSAQISLSMESWQQMELYHRQTHLLCTTASARLSTIRGYLLFNVISMTPMQYV